MTESLTSHSLFNQLQSDLLLPFYCNHVSKKSTFTLPNPMATSLSSFDSTPWQHSTCTGTSSLKRSSLSASSPRSGVSCDLTAPSQDLLWLLLLYWTSQFWGFQSLRHCLLSFSSFPLSLLSSLWSFQNISPTQSSPPSSTHRFSWLPDTWVFYQTAREGQSVSCSVVSDSLWPCGLSLPGSSVHGILQARILEWVAISFSSSSQPRDWTQVSHIAGRLFTIWATWEANSISRINAIPPFLYSPLSLCPSPSL